MLWPQAMGSHQTNVEVDVLRDRRCDDTLWQGLDQEMSGLFTEGLAGVLRQLSPTSEHLVPDVEPGVGPRALGQVFDHRRNATVAIDQKDVALPDVAVQLIRYEVVRAYLILVAMIFTLLLCIGMSRYFKKKWDKKPNSEGFAAGTVIPLMASPIPIAVGLVHLIQGILIQIAPKAYLLKMLGMF